MFLLSTLMYFSFAEEAPQDDLEEREVVVSSKGRLIVLNPDKTWDILSEDDDACHSHVLQGQTEHNGYTFQIKGDAFLTKGKAFAYIVSVHPDKSSDVIVQFFHNKGTFQEQFDISFQNNHFFQNLEFERIHIPHVGWSFQFQKDLNSSLITDFRTKYVHYLENHKTKKFVFSDVSAKKLRAKVQCLYQATYNYMNDPKSIKNREIYLRENPPKIEAPPEEKPNPEETTPETEDPKENKNNIKKSKAKPL